MPSLFTRADITIKQLAVTKLRAALLLLFLPPHLGICSDRNAQVLLLQASACPLSSFLPSQQECALMPPPQAACLLALSFAASRFED